MQNIIQTLNWNDFFSNRNERLFVDKLRQAFQGTGFFLLENHPIPLPLLKECKEIYKQFFKETSEEERMKYLHKNYKNGKGYYPMSVETGEFASIADYKHFYHVQQEGNPFIYEVPDFKYVTETLFSAFNYLYRQLMRAVALSLDLPRNYFDYDLGNSTMRPIHYPALANPTIEDELLTEGGNVIGMCASKHSDINNLTLLFTEEQGLQLLFEGEMIPVQCSPEKLVINVGDMLQHLTGGLYKSGIHRVVCQPNIERFSCPFFGHRKLEYSVVPLEHLGPHDFKKFPFKTVGEYLSFRLRQLGL